MNNPEENGEYDIYNLQSYELTSKQTSVLRNELQFSKQQSRFRFVW